MNWYKPDQVFKWRHNSKVGLTLIHPTGGRHRVRLMAPFPSVAKSTVIGPFFHCFWRFWNGSGALQSSAINQITHPAPSKLRAIGESKAPNGKAQLRGLWGKWRQYAWTISIPLCARSRPLDYLWVIEDHGQKTFLRYVSRRRYLGSWGILYDRFHDTLDAGREQVHWGGTVTKLVFVYISLSSSSSSYLA